MIFCSVQNVQSLPVLQVREVVGGAGVQQRRAEEMTDSPQLGFA